MQECKEGVQARAGKARTRAVGFEARDLGQPVACEHSLAHGEDVPEWAELLPRS